TTRASSSGYQGIEARSPEPEVRRGSQGRESEGGENPLVPDGQSQGQERQSAPVPLSRAPELFAHRRPGWRCFLLAPGFWRLSSWLEVELRCQRDDARTPCAGQGPEAEAPAIAAESVRQVDDSCAVTAEGHGAVEVVEPGMVPGVEHLHAKLDVLAFAPTQVGDVLEHRDVPVVVAGAVDQPRRRVEALAALEGRQFEARRRGVDPRVV